MTRFMSRYADEVLGVLSGFDRLVFRGTLRRIANVAGFSIYLTAKKVLLKDFGVHVETATAELVAQTVQQAQEANVPVIWVESSKVNKEAKALEVVGERGIQEGPICVLKTLEPCKTFDVHRNREAKRLELVMRERKCAYFYHYQFHPQMGLLHARVQTWFPFNVQICLNGREWLARQMDAAGIDYERYDNCFARVGDFDRAQELLQEQLKTDWGEQFDAIARAINPIWETQFQDFPSDYYWSTYQMEWATDVVFKEPEVLSRLYPLWLKQGMIGLHSQDIMRFLGQKVLAGNRIPPTFKGEVGASLKGREEGVRIKHALAGNSVKLYDKVHSATRALLRGEATITNPAGLKAYRPKEGGPEEDLQWRRLRRGVADLHRLAEISQRATERYLDALASVDDSVQLGEVTAKVTRPATYRGKRVRALNPFAAADLQLLAAVGHGEFTLTGMRNRDLQALLFEDEAPTPQERRRRSAWVGRRIRLLRAHGILQKVNGTHRYQVTAEGRTLITAVLLGVKSPIRWLAEEPQQRAA